MPDVFKGLIMDKDKIGDLLYKFTIVVSKSLAEQFRAGQFIHIKCGDERILRRPISISDVTGGDISFVIEVKGDGTKWLSERNVDEVLDVIGPLGNGFVLPEGKVVVVGGGVGAPPLMYAAKSASGSVSAVLGFRSKDKMMLPDEFEDICDSVVVTTDDGSYGIHGTVVEPLKLLLDKGDYSAVLTCGPRSMMEAVAKLCLEYGIPCQVSLEERMGCGVGACYVCACRTLKDGAEYMSRVCVEGPVFDAMDVVW